MKNETRKQNLYNRISVKWLGNGHYRFYLAYYGKRLTWLTTESPLYDEFMHDPTLRQLEHLAKLIRYYGNEV